MRPREVEHQQARGRPASTRCSSRSTFWVVDRSSSPRRATWMPPPVPRGLEPRGWSYSVRGYPVAGPEATRRTARRAGMRRQLHARRRRARSARSGTALATTVPATTPIGESTADDQPVAQAQVAVAALAPRAHRGAPARWPAARCASRSSWVSAEEDHEPGHEQHAAAHAHQPAEHPGGEADRRVPEQVRRLHQSTSTAAETTSSTANTPDTARSGIRCCRAVPARTPPTAGSADQQRLERVDVAVGGVHPAAERGDHGDGRQRGARGLALPVAEPQDQQGHDDRAAPDAEQAAEGARRGGDHGQPERASADIGEAYYEPCPLPLPNTLAETPPPPHRRSRRARPSSATSTARWRRSSAAPRSPACARRCRGCSAAWGAATACVACVSGRPVAEARRLVGVGSIAYVGSHGAEILRRRASSSPRLLAPSPAGRGGARSSCATRENRDAASSCACASRTRARSRRSTGAAHPTRRRPRRCWRAWRRRPRTPGLDIHWGRKVLEIRPPVHVDKGQAVRALVERADGRARRSTAATT